ncbi:MAG TPA: M15 family metallopeptidase [Bdellovibrionales bacterium]|nr:M15 family metallopeptidase [Bdellovibrionales bacterium]
MEMQIGDPFVELTHFNGFKIDLRYASTNNFTGENVYGEFNRAYLHKFAAEKLRRAAALIFEKRPGTQILILDALRPRSAQRKLFSKVEGTPYEKYVANPNRGSLHNFGFAVDLTLADGEGRELDMGSGFDDFRPISEPSRENEFFEQGLLTREHLDNRRLLRDAMVAAGFIAIPHEWWHFNALTLDQAKASFQIVE